MKKSQLASIELLNGVSNVDGKRRVSASVKETGVNVDGKGGGCRASVGLTLSHVHGCVCRKEKKELSIREGIDSLSFQRITFTGLARTSD